ncbi:ABC transporter permease [Actinobacillus seminis]|uniref:ABC transporter permease n=1 Tax=Actinobacillus seminis TaxID=722 RepID=A0A263HC80_9PAST|nr:cytochrome c biogenesis protein CcsA [Actinobacillus seminis]OZN25054.1 ABC transporter permease [Actinobacillus seminis]SUU38874.1 cytochrome c assembly protein [Actinobacillus seminis]
MEFAFVSVLLYLLSILLIVPLLVKAHSSGRMEKRKQYVFFLTALFALICHLVSLHTLIHHLFSGQRFTLMDVGSLLSVIIAGLATVAMIFRVNTLWVLLPIVYCFAIINLILQALLPGSIVQHLAQNTGLLIHIGLALFAYALCFIATLYAIQLRWIDYQLKSKKMALSPLIPPLMTVERHFFRLLLTGEILLTLTLVSGAIYLADFFATQNIQKAWLSLMAWMIFGIALLGHWKLYWRGKKMIVYTISGMILLTVAYFGSRVMFAL